MDLRQYESDILLKAAEYISEHGWTKETYEDDEGRVCALGALARVQGSDIKRGAGGVTSVASFHIPSALLTYVHGTENGIPGWNDHPNTTAEDVVLTFKRLATEAS